MRSFALVRCPRQTSKIVSKFFYKVLKICVFFPKKTERRISKKRPKLSFLELIIIFSKQELGSTRGVNFTAVFKFELFSYGPKRDSDPRFRSPIEKQPLFMYSTMTGNFLAFFDNFWPFSAKNANFTQSMACWGSNRSESRGRSPREIKSKISYWEHLFANFLALFVTFWLSQPISAPE